MAQGKWMCIQLKSAQQSQILQSYYEVIIQMAVQIQKELTLNKRIFNDRKNPEYLLYSRKNYSFTICSKCDVTCNFGQSFFMSPQFGCTIVTQDRQDYRALGGKEHHASYREKFLSKGKMQLGCKFHLYRKRVITFSQGQNSELI